MKKIVLALLIAIAGGVVALSLSHLIDNEEPVYSDVPLTVAVQQASYTSTTPVNLPTLAYGNSDEVKIGEWVLAVGNPFNLTSTVTAGIVSAKARNINILGSQGAIESFIQTDAAVNRGNSGGALVNTRGELVGVNAAIASGTGFYQGYSFAIPVNIVRKVVDDLMTFGRIQRAYMGIYYREIDDKFAKDHGLEKPQGIYIQDVLEGGSAYNGGLQKGDIILAMSNSPVNSKSELTEFMGQHNPGEKVMVKIWRDGKIKLQPITLMSDNSKESG